MKTPVEKRATRPPSINPAHNHAPGSHQGHAHTAHARGTKGCRQALVVLLCLGALLNLSCVQANIGRDIRDKLKIRGQQQQTEEADQERTLYACEGSTLSVECRQGRVINILRSNYGRFKVDLCNQGGPTKDWNLQCMSTKAPALVQDLCENKKECWIPATNRFFGEPCDGTPKYLQVQFRCVTPPIERPTLPPRPPRTRAPTTTRSTTPNPPVSTTTSPSECPANQVWKRCGSACTLTCTDQTPLCTRQCVERCACPPHLPMWHEGRCIHASQCPVNDECEGGKVWNSCGSPCTKTCNKEPQMCAAVCVAQCECPKSKPILHDGTCITASQCTGSTPVTSRPIAPGRAVCEAEVRRNISWPRTQAGEQAERPCPNNLEGTARWICTNRGWRGTPDLSQCKSRAVGNLVNKAKEAKSVLKELSQLALDVEHPVPPEVLARKQQAALRIVEEVSHDLINCSAQPMADTYGGDVDGITFAMQELVDQIDVSMHDPTTTKIVKEVNKAVVESSNNMLEKDKTSSWLDLPQAEQAKAATRVINSVEESAYKLADAFNEPMVQMDVKVNLVLEVNVVDTSGDVTDDVSFDLGSQKFKDTPWRGNSNSIKLSATSIKQLGVNGLAKVIFATYKNIEQYLTNMQSDEPIADEDAMYDPVEENGNSFSVATIDKEKAEEVMKDMFVNTQVIAASVNGRKDSVTLPEPVYYTLQHNAVKNDHEHTCAFWEYSEKNEFTGRWSTVGCLVHKTNTTHTVCKCEHLTNFAVLMDTRSMEISEPHRLALSLITYFGCIISLICLLLAWLTFTFVKSLQCDRNTIHKNLVFCLFAAELIFLVGIGQADKETLCSVVAGLLHYFFLAAFSWMCLEGVQLYVMLIEVFEAERSRTLWYYLSGYGIPAIIVGITAAVRPEGYGTEKYCWLSVEQGVIWAFLGPVILVMVLNSVMLGVAIYMMCRHAQATAAWKMKQRTRSENITSWMKGAFVLVVLLGLTWTLGLVYVNKETLVMAYIFTFSNTLQGLFIYIFHCILNEKVQKEYKKIVRKTRWLPDCVRVKYGGASSSGMSSPNNSSSGNAPKPDKLSSFEALQRLLSSRFRKRSSTTSIPKSSLSTPGKWTYEAVAAKRLSNSHEQARLVRDSSGSNAPDSAFYSDGNPGNDQEYLAPQPCIRLDINDPVADFSLIEGSICDTDYFDQQMCSPTSPNKPAVIDVNKYKIKAPPSLKPEQRKLPAIPQRAEPEADEDIVENEYAELDDPRLIESRRQHVVEIDDTHAQGIDVQLLPVLSSDDAYSDDDSIKKRPLSSDSGNQSPGLNDLNKLDLSSLSSQEDISTPNIAFKNTSSKPASKEPFYFDYGYSTNVNEEVPSGTERKGQVGPSSNAEIETKSLERPVPKPCGLVVSDL